MSARVTIIQRIISLFHRRTWLVIRDPARVELSPITPGCRSSMSVYFYFFFLSFFLSNTSNTRGIGIFPARIRICLGWSSHLVRERNLLRLGSRSKNAEKEAFFSRAKNGWSLVIFNWGETNSFKGGRGEGRGSGTTLFQRAMTRRGSHVNYPLRRDETFRVVHGLRDKEVRLCW